MKRHQVLDRELHESLSKTRRLRWQEWKSLEQWLAEAGRPKGEHRIGQLAWAVGHATLQHLGYAPVKDLGSVLKTGVDQAIDFFYGDWWEAHEYDRYMVEKGGAHPVQGWHWAFLYGVLLCDWSEHWDAAGRLFDWIDDDVARGSSHGDPYLNYHLFLVSSAHRRLANHEELRASIEWDSEATAYELRLLETCDALGQGDGETFADRLLEVVNEFHRTESQDVPNFLYWISLDASLLWTIASRREMPLPDLDPLQDATIVRNASVHEGRDEGTGASGRRWAFWKK